MKVYRIGVALLTLLLVVSCGGGGGGGSQQGASAGSGRLQVKSYPPIQYNGVNTQAVIEQASVPEFTSHFYTLFTLIDGLTFYIFDGRELKLVRFPEDPGAIDEECQSGSQVVEDQTDINGFGNLIIEFTDCVIDDTRFTGQVVYEFIEYDPTGPYYEEKVEVRIGNLSIESMEEKLVLQGDFTFILNYYNVDGCQLQGDAIATSRYQDKVLQLKNVCARDDFLQADLYDSSRGYTEVSWHERRDTFSLVGAEDTVATISLLFDAADEYLEFFDVALTNGSLGAFPLRGVFEVDRFLDWPYENNEKPVIHEDIAIEVDRLAERELQLSGYVTDNQDLLKYDFMHISTPQECVYESNQEQFDSIRFSLSCQGAYELLVQISDGVNEPIMAPVTVNVLPLAAEVDALEKLSINYGESINIALHVANESTDGPFQYSVAYAPPGMSVSQKGVVTGTPTLPIREGTAYVGLSVDNGKQTIVELTIDIDEDSSGREVIPFSDKISCLDGLFEWGDINQDGKADQVCSFGNTYVIKELDGGVESIAYVAPDVYQDSRLQHVYTQNVLNGSEEEIVLRYQDSIIIVEPYTSRVLKRIVFSENPDIDLSGGRISMYRIEGGSSNLILKSAENMYLYSVVSEQVVASFSGVGLILGGLGNIDSDPEPEFIFNNGYLYNFGEEPIYVWDILGQKFHFANLVGDERDELITYESTEVCCDSSVKFSIYDPSDLSLIDEVSLEMPSWTYPSNYNNSSIKYLSRNIAEKDELFISGCFDNTMCHYKFDQGQFVKVGELTPALGGWLSFVPGGVYFGLGYIKLDDSGEIIKLDRVASFSNNVGVAELHDQGRVNNIYAEVDGELSQMVFDGEGALSDIVQLGVGASDLYLPSQFEFSRMLASDSSSIAFSDVYYERQADVISIVDGATLSTFDFGRSMDSNSRLLPANFDGDGSIKVFQCGYGFSQNATLEYYEASNSVPLWGYDVSGGFYRNHCEALAVDYESGSQSIATVQSYGRNELHFGVFDYSSGDFSQAFFVELGLDQYEQVGDGFYIESLDVFSDAVPEYLILGNLFWGKGSSGWVVSHDGVVQSSFDLPYNDLKILNGYHQLESSHVMFSASFGALTKISSNASKLYYRLYELDSRSGKIVWESESITGEVNQNGYYSLLSDRGRKMVVTDYGLYFFE